MLKMFCLNERLRVLTPTQTTVQTAFKQFWVSSMAVTFFADDGYCPHWRRSIFTEDILRGHGIEVAGVFNAMILSPIIYVMTLFLGG